VNVRCQRRLADRQGQRRIGHLGRPRPGARTDRRRTATADPDRIVDHPARSLIRLFSATLRSGLPGARHTLSAVMRGRCAMQHDRNHRTELGFRRLFWGGAVGSARSAYRRQGSARTGADAASYQACGCDLVGYVSNGVRVVAALGACGRKQRPGRCGSRRGLRSGGRGAGAGRAGRLRPSSSAPE
jgi:hypothetical protein